MKQFFLGKKENSERNSFIWNMIASAVNAAEAVVVLMVATRFAGIDNAGILTISFTVANLMMCIGKYGVRNYQVTDVEEKKSASSYFYSRLITLGIMAFFTACFIVFSVSFSGYTAEKVLVVLLTVGIYGIEAFEDVFLSEFQRRERLDIGAKMFSVRWLVTLLTWCGGIFIFKSILLPTLLAFLVDLFVVALLSLGISKGLLDRKSKLNEVCFDNKILEKMENGNNSIGNEVKTILLHCLPLCVVAVLIIYLPNASKYAIDFYLDDSLQAYYGFIAMPVFVIDVISFVIFQPLLPGLAQQWAQNNRKQFAFGILKLSGIVLGISALCLLAGYFLGIPVLSILYAVDLSGYKVPFMILLFAGIAQAFIGLANAILVIFRKQILLTIPFVIVSLATFAGLNFTVQRYEILGASITSAASLMVLCLILFVEILVVFMRGKRA